jgi:hypothetical protein
MIKGKEDPFMQISTIGIDIGKTSFHFVGFDARGGIVVAAPVLADATHSGTGEAASVSRGDGGLLWCAPVATENSVHIDAIEVAASER